MQQGVAYREQPASQVPGSGHQRVERAPGMNLIPFSYRCEVEPRSGRVTAISTKE